MATSSSQCTSDDEENYESIIVKSFLNLEKIDVDLYRSDHEQLWQPRGGRAVFGGQVVGQALAAAAYSVPSDQHAHSLHCYFLRPGNANHPILYTVDRTRDGNIYRSRNVKAKQDGKAIFTMQASFKSAETDPYHHQFTMPVVPPPEECIDVSKPIDKFFGRSDKNSTKRKTGMNHRITKDEVSILIQRAVKRSSKTSSLPARRCFWFKAAGRLGHDHREHQCCAAYMSDSSLLGTAILPGLKESGKRFFITSIDHAIWFHSDFRADEWLLYEMESAFCGAGRAHCAGRMWTQDGRLVMSVVQEGVVRTYEPRPPDAYSAKSQL